MNTTVFSDDIVQSGRQSCKLLANMLLQHFYPADGDRTSFREDNYTKLHGATVQATVRLANTFT